MQGRGGEPGLRSSETESLFAFTGDGVRDVNGCI